MPTIRAKKPITALTIVAISAGFESVSPVSGAFEEPVPVCEEPDEPSFVTIPGMSGGLIDVPVLDRMLWKDVVKVPCPT